MKTQEQSTGLWEHHENQHDKTQNSYCQEKLSYSNKKNCFLSPKAEINSQLK